MVLVDTSVWVDFFNGNDTIEVDELEVLLGSRRILTGDLILAELLQGFARDIDFRRAIRVLSDLPCSNLVGRDVALESAANYRKLRSLGITVRKTIDVIIGTFCILHGHELLHSDRDFGPMQGLGLRVYR